MISRFLYSRARRHARNAFEAYLVAAQDKHAWRGIVAGADALPWWLRPAQGPLERCDVRILVGRPAETLLLIDEVERTAGATIRDVWPSLRGYLHSGVEFAPYAATYRKRLGHGVVFVEAQPVERGHWLNAFGEQLARPQVEQALATAQELCGGVVRRWRVEAEFPTVSQSRGRHVFRIDCTMPPSDLAEFARAIDAALEHPARGFLRPPIVRLLASGSLT